jgi:hypothetical protein
MSRPYAATCPTVIGLSWGSIMVKTPDGATKEFIDAILGPLHCCDWNWRRSGDSLLGCIRALVETGEATEVILSTGMIGHAQPSRDALDYLVAKRVPHWVCCSEEATRIYAKKVASGISVCMLLHSTC